MSRPAGHAMKARLRIVILLALTVLLGGMGWLVFRALETNEKFELAQKVLELVPDAAQRIQDFRRVQVRDGRKEWEIAAREARYFDEEQRVLVREPMVRLYLTDGRVVGIRGDEGVVLLDGRELRSVDLTGAIEVTLAEYTVRTAAAHYDRGADTIRAPGGVEISGGELDARGTGMEVDVRTQKLRLLDEVQMILRPRKAVGDDT
jgi:LPS export ABC transporter protein LptC